MTIQWREESSNAALKTLDFESSKAYIIVRKNLRIEDHPSHMEDGTTEKVYTYDSAFMTPQQYMEYAGTFPTELISGSNENGQYTDHPNGEVVITQSLETTETSGLWIFPCGVNEITKVLAFSTTGELVSTKVTPIGLEWSVETPVAGKILFNVQGIR